MAKIVILLLGFMLLSPAMVSTTALCAENELVLANFEKWPNNVGGEIGVYGSLEPNWSEKTTVPYSWIYEPDTPGYSADNVYNGRQSFRLVNALGTKPDEAWGSFAMNLGPILDATTVPITVESKDVSGYKYLTFWMKGKDGGEHLELIFRDAHAVSYMPQTKYEIPDASTKWQKIAIPLNKLKDKIDLTALDNVGIAFGPDVGNAEGAMVYLDDFIFANNK
jgi:hypothetical protein